MTARAVIKQADLTRALKAAAKLGYEVRIKGDTIHLLPAQRDAAQPPPDQAVDDWDEALGLK